MILPPEYKLPLTFIRLATSASAIDLPTAAGARPEVLMSVLASISAMVKAARLISPTLSKSAPCPIFIKALLLELIMDSAKAKLIAAAVSRFTLSRAVMIFFASRLRLPGNNIFPITFKLAEPMSILDCCSIRLSLLATEAPAIAPAVAFTLSSLLGNQFFKLEFLAAKLIS